MLEDFEDFFKTKAIFEITKTIEELVGIDEILRKFFCLPPANQINSKKYNKLN